jgi:phospholipid/cholesterol/gamma-HCH transport system substrate-binding protein
MKAFTELNQKVVGAVVIGVVLLVVAGVLLLNRGVFAGHYDVIARFANASGLRSGDQILMAGVRVGQVGPVRLSGDRVRVDLYVNDGVTLPRDTSAAIRVQTLLGLLDVALKPGNDWGHPLHDGSVIADTSVPTEFYDVENAAGTLLAQSNAAYLNQLVLSLGTVTAGEQQQVAQIIDGLDRITSVVDQRRGNVSQLIDSAGSLSATLAARDQQLVGLIDNLDTVVGGLAARRGDLAGLIDNIDSSARQTSGLIGSNRAQLDSLLSNLHTDLSVIDQHQVDLAQGVAYLGSAIHGFASIGYSGPNETPNQWANVFTNLTGPTGVYGVLGPCGALDAALNAALGPDPAACDQRSGPLPTGSASGGVSSVLHAVAGG